MPDGGGHALFHHSKTYTRDGHYDMFLAETHKMRGTNKSQYMMTSGKHFTFNNMQRIDADILFIIWSNMWRFPLQTWHSVPIDVIFSKERRRTFRVSVLHPALSALSPNSSLLELLYYRLPSMAASAVEKVRSLQMIPLDTPILKASESATYALGDLPLRLLDAHRLLHLHCRDCRPNWEAGHGRSSSQDVLC
eukprot:3779683-Amphidinium_carterae.3